MAMIEIIKFDEHDSTIRCFKHPCQFVFESENAEEIEFIVNATKVAKENGFEEICNSGFENDNKFYVNGIEDKVSVISSEFKGFKNSFDKMISDGCALCDKHDVLRLHKWFGRTMLCIEFCKKNY